ncbi:MAG: hypothetical protein ACYDCI_08410 [Candidatus Limnocylindrales bacterium]
MGGIELVRRIFVAVRTPTWDTVPGMVTDLRVEARADSFSVSYRSQHRRGSLAFAWQATIEGQATGELDFVMAGAADADFEFGRIGICVLLPPGEYAGQPYRAETVEGSVAGRLPTLIEAQRKRDGLSLPLVPWFRQLHVEARSGPEIDITFEGDVFGIEDQRNWMDASFKIYSTRPIAGNRHAVRRGQILRQAMAIHPVLTPASPQRPSRPTPRSTVELEVTHVEADFPRLGVGLGADAPSGPRQERLLRALRLDHLRVDLRLFAPDWLPRLERAAAQAVRIGSRIELALFVTDEAEAELSVLTRSIEGNNVLRGVEVARVLVFHEPQAEWETTGATWVALARERLQDPLPATSFGGGTNGYLAELVRMPPDPMTIDIVSYTANPQVHASDEASLAENLETLGAGVRTARAVSGGADIAVSRLTLRPPFNQSDPRDRARHGEVPAETDPRQASLFGAAWTVGALKYLAESGLASLTAYETTGPAGLMESTPRSSTSGWGRVFPLFHVFADLVQWRRHGRVMECRSSDPLAVVGLAMRRTLTPGQRGVPRSMQFEQRGVLVANLSPAPQTAVVSMAGASGVARLRSMDETNAFEAMFKPASFRRRWTDVGAERGVLRVRLRPYGVTLVVTLVAEGDG